jgi:hypothetical protein
MELLSVSPLLFKEFKSFLATLVAILITLNRSVVKAGLQTQSVFDSPFLINLLKLHFQNQHHLFFELSSSCHQFNFLAQLLRFLNVEYECCCQLVFI